MPLALAQATGARTQASRKGAGLAEYPMAGDDDFLEAPEWLDATAMELWAYYYPLLRRVDGLLTFTDRDVLAMFCANAATFVRAQKAIRENGHVIDGKKNPEISIAEAAYKNMADGMRRLGLSPSDRAAMLVPENKVGKKTDPLAEFLD